MSNSNLNTLINTLKAVKEAKVAAHTPKHTIGSLILDLLESKSTEPTCMDVAIEELENTGYTVDMTAMEIIKTPTTTETNTMSLPYMIQLAATKQDQMVATYHAGDKLEYDLLSEELTELEIAIEIAVGNELDKEEAKLDSSFKNDHGMDEMEFYGIEEPTEIDLVAEWKDEAAQHNWDDKLAAAYHDGDKLEYDLLVEERDAEEAKMARDIQEYGDSLPNMPF